MEIPQTLLKFKLPYVFLALSFSVAIASIIYVAPSLLDVLAYFWPLLLSTALFLAAVVVFGRTSPPAAEVSGEKAAEGLLDFVAGQPPPEPELEPESEKVQTDTAEGSHESEQM